MLNPKVSVITITYNLLNAGREHMFRQCIDSVYTQNYPNIEHIVIDGASKDGTLKIIQEYAKQGKITYFSEPDTGIYNAMNKGLQKATGKYIVFLNSDDFFHEKNGIEKMVMALEKNNADFGFAPCRYLTETDDFIGNLYPVIQNFFVRMPFSHQTLFVKTETMRQLNGFDETFRSAGDYDFVIRLCLSGATYVQISDNFVSYRLGGLSDKQQKQSMDECIKSFEKNYAQFDVPTDYQNMYHQFIVPVQLIQKIQKCVWSKLAHKMQKSLQDVDKKETNCCITKYPLVQPVFIVEKTKWLLFGLLPIWAVKSKQTDCKKNNSFFKYKKTYEFLGIPFLHLSCKQDKLTCYFCGLKIFQRKQKSNVILCKLFYVPCIKIKKY